MAGQRFYESGTRGGARPGGGSGLRTAWRKSSYSNHQSACVEVSNFGQETIAFRDSKDPDGPVLKFTRTEAAVFFAAVAAGEFPGSR
ncbi:protein of unknown function [Actinacidiphila alni]|uniref:DUF397 domain-containing protein n=1 Tax=Actinacidiphila alni TaxID=380248 RepID=A0A1I2MJG3_9ACTN|nr:DUF397 domain-containing protein [Actinacidiphila alni]SFF91592.1 protein of unknown function [Actinacidiphila alni]